MPLGSGSDLTAEDSKMIAACTVAFHGALQTLVMLLEDSGTLQTGQFAAGLKEFISTASDGIDPLTVALLEELSILPRDGSRNSRKS